MHPTASDSEAVLLLSLYFTPFFIAVSTAAPTNASTACPPSSSLTLSNANWIWTNEVSDALEYAPLGSRGFRGTLHVPSGHRAVSASITITADDTYLLYVQGQLIGFGNNWPDARRYDDIALPSPATEVVVAVNSTNYIAEAGVVAVVDLTLDCGSTVGFVTDGSWKYDIEFEDGFERPGFDDSAWTSVFVDGPFGIQPWVGVTIQDPQGEVEGSFLGDLRKC